MKIFEKYFLISIFKSSAVSLVSLVLIFAVLQFIDELGDINKNGYALEEIARYVLFLFPSYFNALFVLAIMIGTVFAIGELNSNKEILIFQTASISIGQIIRKSYKYPFIIAVFCLIVFEIIAPVSWKIADQIKKNAFGEVSDFSTSSSWVKEKNKFFVHKYCIVYVSSLLTGLIFLFLLVENFNFIAEIANFFMIGLTTILNFIGTKYWVFKK